MYDYFGESSLLNHFFADSSVDSHVQTKRERRILRNGKNKKHPKVYYELTDAEAGSHSELLVLHKEHFNLISQRCAEKIRESY